nr:hypothetical protein [uncultured Bacteroides sp.]
MKLEDKKRQAKSIKELLAETDNPLREKTEEIIYSDFLKLVEDAPVNEDISDFIDIDREDFESLLPNK